MIVLHHPSHGHHDPKEPHRFGGQLLPPAEIAERADRILRVLDADPTIEVRVPEIVPRELLLMTHTAPYLEFLEHAHERWRAVTGEDEGAEAVAYIRPIPSTPWREPTDVRAQMGRYSNDVDPILSGTWTAAVAAASTAIAAADVATTEWSAYALTRPPGHHATSEMYGGYCYLNNTALAAARFLQRSPRVAVIDVDAHHGNGTQTIFWERDDVLTISIHGDPEENFPFFLGHPEEKGYGKGTGFNHNFPLPTGTRWREYERVLTSAVDLVRSSGAERLVVALGVDSHVDHGVLALEGDDFFEMGRILASARMPTAFIQEGGYAPGSLESAVPAVLKGFSAES